MNPNENNTDPNPNSATPPPNNPSEQPPVPSQPIPPAVPEAQSPPTNSPVVEAPANQPYDPSSMFNTTTPVGSGPSASAMQQGPTGDDPGKTLGIVGFILSLLAFGPISLVLSIIGRSKSKKAGHSNGLALAGIIISSITIFIGVVIITLLTVGAFKAVDYCKENGTTSQKADGSYTVNCSNDTSSSGSSTMQFDTMPEGTSTMESDTPAPVTQ